MTFYDFFDPKNVEHIKAFHELQKTGVWPRPFWDLLKSNGVELEPSWQMLANAKIADQYVNEALGIHAPPKMRPYLTVDCIITRLHGPQKILLIKRKNKPHGFAFPGGHVDHGETVEDAVKREVMEETGMVLTQLSQFGVYSRPDRDPRGHTISVVFTALSGSEPKAGDDAADARWIPFHEVDEAMFAFDHARIFNDFQQRTRFTLIRGD